VAIIQCETDAPRGCDRRHHSPSSPEQRLYAIPPWRETPFFTPRERAALAWTEAVTEIAKGGVSDELFALAREHFTEKELVDLTMGSSPSTVGTVSRSPFKRRSGATFPLGGKIARPTCKGSILR